MLGLLSTLQDGHITALDWTNSLEDWTMAKQD